MTIFVSDAALLKNFFDVKVKFGDNKEYDLSYKKDDSI